MLQKYKHIEISIDKKYTLLVFENLFIPEVSEFVANIYYKKPYYEFDCELHELVNGMKKKDDMLSRNMILCCIVDKNNQICCTARLYKKSDAYLKLPIETEFEIDLNLFSSQSIYEFSRFASNGKVSFHIIKIMIKFMINKIDIYNSLVFASMDSKVYNNFLNFKFPLYKIGKKSFYMGTETLPIGIKLSELFMVLN